MDRRASLPAIGRLLATPEVRALIERFGRDPVTEALRVSVERARNGGISADSVVADAAHALAGDARGTLVSAINATGVMLHTNLGRAPLGADARRAIAIAGSGYSSLEFDLQTGERGSRHVHAAARLRRLCGAEDALVANNAAAALLLALSALAANTSVIVSRGELIEIGGAFRIPEIVAAGGARLIEVGTTNRTRLADYKDALVEGAIVLKVHRSNFEIVGFTEETSVRELVTLGVPVVYDLGSGLLVPGNSVGIDEPDVPASIRDGADVVVFSGDKLLGGPQAGIAVGKRDFIARMRKHPLMRAMRAGKLVLAALDATLAAYERGERVPTLAALAEDVSTVRARAQRLTELVGRGDVIDTVARVGGGAQPLASIASAGVSFSVPNPDEMASRLRSGDPIVIGRIDKGALILDLRAVTDDELEAMGREVKRALR